MKVLILGGGPAGCAAAYYLKQKGIGDITIVEKEGELGGCSRTRFYYEIPYEFGPQILYTDEHDIRLLIETFVTNKPPRTDDKEYHPKVFLDDSIDDPHDFPITIANVLKLENPEKVIYELYKLNLDRPDFSNFESYMISRIGKTLYETYVKNYNLKQWKIDPKEMVADWAELRTLTLRQKPDMFQGRWQGHPGDYTPLWSGLTEGCEIIEGEVLVSEDMSSVFIDGKKCDADVIVSTLPLGKDLDFVHTCKVFVGIKESGFLMPSYINSFPNCYNFTRIMDYKQQYYVDSDFSLLDFAFQWNEITGLDEDACIEEASWFVKNVLRKNIEDIWVETRKYTYPVHSLHSTRLVEEKLNLAATSKITPIGRCGVHAYVSKDICFRMARIIAEKFGDVIKGGDAKRRVLLSLRDKLR